MRNNVFSNEDMEKIKNYQSQGIPAFVIEHSYETYDKWGNARTGKRFFNSPDDMIYSWMEGRLKKYE